ncbi:MAG: ATP-binding protein, partial [Patescibacteria group bacterium]
NSTGRRVILHIDDIEHLVENQNESRSTHSTLLNLMAGIRDSGFYILASTNEPEKIDPALLQPQRFGVWIHFGLQDEEARLAILQINANRTSKQLRHELFPNEEVRELILRAVVNKTDGFTPRYLAEIATVAKSYLLERIALERDTNIGLTERDLEGFQFTVEDWEKATREVSLRYDKTKMKKRDEALKKFVEKQGMQVGFAGSSVDVPSGHFFPPEIHRQIAASLEREN